MKGQVIKSTGSRCQVKVEDEVFDCQIKGKLRLKGIRTTNPVAVGDWVEIVKEAEDAFLIKKIYERKNYIIRKSINLSKRAHIIASNIDQALLIVTLVSPKTYTGFIDRFLISAEAYHIPVAIVFNKIDLYGEKENAELDELERAYQKIGYPIHRISANEKKDQEFLKELMKGKLTALSGHSGVGKSTIINGVVPDLDLRVQEISRYHDSGQHTTTFAEMHELEQGGYVIDTPGIKGLGLIDIEKEEISHYFIEMRELRSECKFHNCRHVDEPGCAVKKALEKNEIAEFRYKNYLEMFLDEDEKYRTKF